VLLFSFTVASAVNTTFSVQLGTTAVLECPIDTGLVYPRWSGPPDWKKYTMQGNPTRNPGLHHINRVSWSANYKDLVLSNVTWEDEGNYICQFLSPDARFYWSIQLVINREYN